MRRRNQQVIRPYGSGSSSQSNSTSDASVGQVVSELRKMDESLKVLGVCLDRLRQQMRVPTRPPMLH